MKILYYIHSLVVGGAEIVVVNSLLKLKEEGHDVTLVVNQKNDIYLESELEHAGVDIVQLFGDCPKSKIGKLLFKVKKKLIGAKKVWERIFEEKTPDVLHINTFTDFFYQSNFPTSRVVYTFHAEVERSLSLGSTINKKRIEKLAKAGACFCALNSRIADDIKRIFDTENVVIIPNGIDVAHIQSQKITKNSLTDSLGISSDSFLVGHVGRFNKVKNHPKLLEIFSKIRERRDDAYLILVGDGTLQEKALLEDKIAELKLNEYVRFLGIRKDATAIMNALDVFILPSLSESFSLVLVEAQAQGVRCVASDAVPHEVICNPNCFALSLKQSADEWADKAVGNDVRSESESIDKFDLNNVVKKTLSVYQQLCK